MARPHKATSWKASISPACSKPRQSSSCRTTTGRSACRAPTRLPRRRWRRRLWASAYVGYSSTAMMPWLFTRLASGRSSTPDEARDRCSWRPSPIGSAHTPPRTIRAVPNPPRKSRPGETKTHCGGCACTWNDTVSGMTRQNGTRRSNTSRRSTQPSKKRRRCRRPRTQPTSRRLMVIAERTESVMVQAINRALGQALASDPRVVVMGQDVGQLGGVFRATDGLQAQFGARRVFDTPLAESAIVGTAFGMALSGLRPVAEIQFMGFLYKGADQLIAEAG